MKQWLLKGIFILYIAVIALHSATLQAQVTEPNVNSSGQVRKQYTTRSVSDHHIKIDGIGDEAAWNLVPWSGDFIENEPNSGTAPHEQTAFKVLHDDKYLYFSFRAFDHSPDSIINRLSRRDEFPGDWIEINIDSYHDFRTAFSFTLSSSGVKGDEFVSDNGNNWDVSWNPIWEANTHVDSLGWSAEMKIPFSQLRYGNQIEPVWGLQVQRRIFRKEERSMWQFIPQNSGGWVSEFGELRGLQQLPSSMQIELAPYVLAQSEKYEAIEGHPFADGKNSKVTVGLDGKVSVTRDMIIDFTINPDFGQVEADPGAIRLDGYEVFFQERRPFFVESRNLFDYRITGSQAGGEYDSDLLFYSRRIGTSPHGSPTLGANEYAEAPSFTSILGAAKLSGKTKKGLSIGILECVTNKESAIITNGQNERTEVVEPLTNFFVGRAIKDFNKGNTVFGALITAVNRKNDLDFLHTAAYSGAIDFLHYWKNRWYFVSANAIFSRVEGSASAIARTQTNFVHLFQRSDADHYHYDLQRGFLSGTGGTIKVGKFGGKPNKNGGVIKFESGVTWRSPELELNDVGFLLAADEINHFTWAAYQIQRPFSIFRDARFNYNHWARWDFSGTFLYNAFNTNAHVWLKNYWRVGAGFNYNPYDISNNALRGTTALRRPPGYGTFLYINSDSRKAVQANFEINTGYAYEKTVTFISYYAGIRIQPFDALDLSIGPYYDHNTRKQDQFVAHAQYGDVTRSIVSQVDRHSFSVSTRCNFYITPSLSLQFYAQPFIFRATYDQYGYVADPLNPNYDARFHAFANDEIVIEEGLASVDENGDQVTDYTFQTPDLNYIQFRSNLVLRWEYVPGSEFYLVWSQGVTPNAFGDIDTPLLESLTDHVFDATPHQIFLTKFSYRFVR